MPYVPAAGFNVRLLTAMRANGLETPEELAAAAQIPIPSAKALLRSSKAILDSMTLFKLADALHYRARWLIMGVESPARKIAADPDEIRLLEILRACPDERRDAIYDRILEAVHAA